RDSASASTNLTIDPEERFALLNFSSTRTLPDPAPDQLFAGLDVPERNLSGVGFIKSFKGPKGLLEIQCKKFPLAGHSNCALTILKGSGVLISREQQHVKVEFEGPPAQEISELF